MSDKIALGNLKIRCRFPIITLLKCCIHTKYGEHTSVSITCIAKDKEAKNVLANVMEEELEIVSREESGREEILFLGIIVKADIREEGQYARLQMQAVSYTWKMDIERKSRSFQNLSKTYKDVAEAIAREYDADMRWNLPDKQLEHPLIQYQETDYRFLKRILSHLKGDITPEDIKMGICFYAGMRTGNNKGSIELNKYTHSLVLFGDKQRTDNLKERKRTGYEIADMDSVRTGDVIQIQGKTYYVRETRMSFEQNVSSCWCWAFEKECFETIKIPADSLKGAVLTGKVLKTQQEVVRMHLDIDREQPVEEAYDFPWKPITGNLFYCMPETGTKAALYFGKTEEGSGAVTYNVRENGEECSELSDYHNRYFTVKSSKRMYLKPSEIGLLNMTGQNAEIALKDASLLQMKTINKLSILAEGQVELKGKNVTLVTPKEATLVRKDIMMPTVINLCNAFDAIGQSGNFAAIPQVAEKKRRKPNLSQEKEEYSLEGAISAILSNIPADGVENDIMGMIAGSMPVLTRIPGNESR